MKKKLYMLLTLSLAVISLSACNEETISNDVVDSTNKVSIYEDDFGSGNFSDSSSDSYNFDSSSSSAKIIEHYCDADGCYREGRKL